ncbi:uncharacterized protein LOC121861045 isoform X1 [Homarus americanus]|uniref:uncharacterized protein LOC121861045 isoform X1 n=1 Tax=Homarus americanus TaxID=6706 RepID=UPI001C494BF7|nr:uncharacterized protein LOC121861045 isoform X1 [Homarus americanus]
MNYTRRTVLSDGLTDVVVDLPEKEIERIQTDAAYCQHVFDKHAHNDGSTEEDNLQPPGEDARQCTEGAFDRPRKPSKAPWDADMTRFFITEYRSVRSVMTKKREAFLHISEKMNQKGYDVTPYTVEKKWHNLIKTYKNVLDRAIHKGEEKICWEFFEDMDEIIKNSTPALPAPGNLQALAKSRRAYPDQIVSPTPETISVSPDFLPCPPSPELIITTSHSSSSPPSVEGGNTSSPAFNVSTLLSSNVPRSNHMMNNSTSSLSSTEAQNSSPAHFVSDTSSQTHPSFAIKNQIVSTASWPLHSPQNQSSNITNLPAITTHSSSFMQPPNMTSPSLSNGYGSHIQNTAYSKPIDPSHQPDALSVGIVKNDINNRNSLHDAKKRKWKEDKSDVYSCHTEDPDDILSVQREMNVHLKTLNSNILSMGHTLNENILGLKRAVESMVTIMLQNKASA